MVFGYKKVVINGKFSVFLGCPLTVPLDRENFCWGLIVCAHWHFWGLAPSAPTLRYMKQKENWGNTALCHFCGVSRFLSSLPFSLHVWKSMFVFYIMWRLLSLHSGRIGKSKSPKSPSFSKRNPWKINF